MDALQLYPISCSGFRGSPRVDCDFLLITITERRHQLELVGEHGVAEYCRRSGCSVLLASARRDIWPHHLVINYKKKRLCETFSILTSRQPSWSSNSLDVVRPCWMWLVYIILSWHASNLILFIIFATLFVIPLHSSFTYQRHFWLLPPPPTISNRQTSRFVIASIYVTLYHLYE